jgi:heme exporter protein A
LVLKLKDEADCVKVEMTAMTTDTVLNAIDAVPDTAGLSVRIDRLSKRFDERWVLRDICLSVPTGSYLTLLGANGAGKSTLLHTLAMLNPATSGELMLFGKSANRPSPMLRARIGMIGHQPMLYRDLSAIENLVFFGKLYGVSRPTRRANELLDRVGLADRAASLVKTFSRGMVQRLSIARALMHAPDLMLADEPFSGLDVPSVQAVSDLLGELHADGKTVILTNHDVRQSLELAQRVVVLRRGAVVCDQQTRHTDADEVTREVIGP